jgi:DNA-binding NarL/FixJ family response regulator
VDPGSGHARAVARYLAQIGASSAEGEDLVLALTRRTGGETFDVDGVLLQPELLECVPESLALENRILPIHRAGEILFVAVPSGERPQDGIDELELLLGLQVESVPVAELDVTGLLVKAHQLLRRRGRLAAAPSSEPEPAPMKDELPLASQGMPAEILQRLQQALAEPQGLILLSGPAGSGKSTTLRAIAAEFRQQDLRVAALGRSEGLAAVDEALAADPDAVLIDGPESPSVAARAVRAAVEGRRVVLAIEAPDGAAAVARLAELKVDPHLVATALRAGLHQRLLKRVCSACREEYREEAATLEDLRLEGLLRDVPLRRGRGCKACSGSGMRGRVAIFEYGEWGKPQSVRAGLQPLVADAMAKLVGGLTTLEELLEQVPYTQVLQAADRLNVRRIPPHP